MIMMIVVVVMIVIGIGVDILLPTVCFEKSKRRIMNHEDNVLFSCTTTIISPSREKERRKSQRKKKKSQIYPPFALRPTLLSIVILPYPLTYPIPCIQNPAFLSSYVEDLQLDMDMDMDIWTYG